MADTGEVYAAGNMWSGCGQVVLRKAEYIPQNLGRQTACRSTCIGRASSSHIGLHCRLELPTERADCDTTSAVNAEAEVHGGRWELPRKDGLEESYRGPFGLTDLGRSCLAVVLSVNMAGEDKMQAGRVTSVTTHDAHSHGPKDPSCLTSGQTALTLVLPRCLYACFSC